MLERTIILTTSVRVTAANEKDLDTLCHNLERAVDVAYDNGTISQGCDDGTEVGTITSDTEVCNDEEDEEDK